MAGELAAALKDAVERPGELEGRLKDPELFLSVALEASATALKTHEATKRAGLRNAVVNTATGQSLDEATASDVRRLAGPDDRVAPNAPRLPQ
jgi:hypothetical protein